MPDLQESLVKNTPLAKLAQTVFGAIWSFIGPFVEHFLHPLYRVSSKSSFGKIWSSALLVTCMYYWWKLQKDIPESLEYMVQVLLLYVFSSKPVQIVRDHMAGKAPTTVPDTSAPKAAGPATPAATPAAEDGDGA
jgi:hypothetical protein